VKRITDLYVQKRFAPPENASTADAKVADDAWQQARRWLRRALLRRR
jgi:hypothetical protein